jgi:malate/lactate dehydrogenase
MERKELLDKNAGIFKEQGIALQQYAARHCKAIGVRQHNAQRSLFA